MVDFDPSVIPDDFRVHVILRTSDVPHPAATLCVLHVDSLGHAGALEWAVAHPDVPKVLAFGELGGDIMPLAAHCRGICSRPDPRLGHHGWRQRAWEIWFAIKNPDYRDPTWDNEPGGVSREEFEEHLRAAADGTADDGATC